LFRIELIQVVSHQSFSIVFVRSVIMIELMQVVCFLLRSDLQHP